jgi:hypothetical protein
MEQEQSEASDDESSGDRHEEMPLLNSSLCAVLRTLNLPALLLFS